MRFQNTLLILCVPQTVMCALIMHNGDKIKALKDSTIQSLGWTFDTVLSHKPLETDGAYKHGEDTRENDANIKNFDRHIEIDNTLDDIVLVEGESDEQTGPVPLYIVKSNDDFVPSITKQGIDKYVGNKENNFLTENNESKIKFNSTGDTILVLDDELASGSGSGLSKTDDSDRDLSIGSTLIEDDWFIATDQSTKINKGRSHIVEMIEECNISAAQWLPWTQWLQLGDQDVRLRSCQSSDRSQCGNFSCEGSAVDTRYCRRERNDLRTKAVDGSKDELAETCEALKLDDLDLGVFWTHLMEKDNCEFTLIDLKYQMPIGEPLTTQNLMASDTNVWCDKQHMPVYTPGKQCKQIIQTFCSTKKGCPAKDRISTPGAKLSGLKNKCWKKFVFGDLPSGLPFYAGSRIICQRFSKEGRFGQLLGHKEDYFASIYNTEMRMPLLSIATVTSLGPNKWPNAPYLVEASLVSNVPMDRVSNLFEHKRTGLLTIDDMTGNHEHHCGIGTAQALPDDFNGSLYQAFPLITPDLLQANIATRIAAFASTNTVPMHATLVPFWRKAILRIRKLALEKCNLPYYEYNNVEETKPNKTLYLLTGTLLSYPHTDMFAVGNNVTVPDTIWMAACCKFGHFVKSVGVITRNAYGALPTFLSVADLQIEIQTQLDSSERVDIFRDANDACARSENDVSNEVHK